MAGLLVGCLARTGSAASIFDFEGDPVNQGTAFTDISNGISATFTSPGDPGGFGINQGFFSALSGNVLIDPGPAGLNDLVLNIGFSSVLSSIDLDFAVNAANPVPLMLTASLDGATVGTVNAASGFPNAGAQSPEGHITFSGVGFNSVALSSDATNFAIDNVTVVNAAAVPEPATAGLLGAAFGVLGIGATARRLRRR